jgi:sugar (pentulose or hexulose) kinase
MDLALGIDVGTSGVRALAMNCNGQIAARAEVGMPAPVRVDGHLQQDPQIWWAALCKTLDQLRRSVGLERVAAIALDGTSGTILPLDTRGSPVGLASMYNDTAEALAVAQVAEAAPHDTAALGATSPLARALTMQNIPGVARIAHQADWIAGQLSGDFSFSDETNALKSGYDPRSRSWPCWVARCGLNLTLLPKVFPSGSRVGTISPGAAARFGFSKDTAIVAGTTDGCAAFLATGARETGAGVTSLGSTLTIKLLSRVPVFSPEFGIYSHRIGDQWLAGGASNAGGAVLLHYFDRDRMAALESRLDPDQPTGLDYYPLLAPGERFPINDPRYPPRISPRPADDAKFFQALLEGIANVERLAYQRLNEIGASPLSSVRTVGGGARNHAWSAIRRRLMGVPFKAAMSEEAGAGTAMLAWRGMGVVVGS